MGTAKTITLFILFVTTLSLFPLAADAFSFSFGIAPQVAVKKTTDVTTKAQAGISTGTSLSVGVYGNYFFELRGRYLYYRASSPGEDWILYRAFSALGASIGGGVILPDYKIFSEFSVTPSVTLRGYGNFASYSYTEIYFFYPSLQIEPGFTFARYYNDQLQLKLSIPVEWSFQRDLDLFVSGGISFTTSLYF
ncbi:MAG: hypothetical protein U5P10_08800 [Spirochaetia bacterium]|nr:hypothetical protein [Spirochaetia bacterium]